jgi:hypothetical protein
MKKSLFTALALLIAATGFTAAAAHADDAKLTASKTGKDVFCRAKVSFKNGLDQTIQLDRVRVVSGSDSKFYSEFELSGSRYRPVSGATVSTPSVDVMVPAGHKLAIEATYRTQITAGANPKFSAPKTDSSGIGAIQPACSIEGQELNITVN